MHSYLDKKIYSCQKWVLQTCSRVRSSRYLSLGEGVNWFTSLCPNSIDSWDSLEHIFHDYFYNEEVELRLSNLTSLRQKYTKTISDYLRWFREV
jgi:hypothetical protein